MQRSPDLEKKRHHFFRTKSNQAQSDQQKKKKEKGKSSLVINVHLDAIFAPFHILFFLRALNALQTFSLSFSFKHEKKSTSISGGKSKNKDANEKSRRYLGRAEDRQNRRNKEQNCILKDTG